MITNWLILGVHKDNIVHIACYTEEPSANDISHLRKELSIDEEFGLTEIIDQISFSVIGLESAVDDKDLL